MRDRGLADPELRPHHLGHGARRLLALEQQLQDPPPYRVAEDVERFHGDVY